MHKSYQSQSSDLEDRKSKKEHISTCLIYNSVQKLNHLMASGEHVWVVIMQKQKWYAYSQDLFIPPDL